MKQRSGHLVASIFYFAGGICFFLAAILQKQPLPRWGFLFAGVCLLVSGFGFLHASLKCKDK